MRANRRQTARAVAVSLALGVVVLPSWGLLRADELDRYLETMQRQMDDPARPIAERRRLALEAAAALDRAAQDGRDAFAARAAWERAARLLEGFADRAGADVGAETASLRLQAAVYRWAQARTRLALALLHPADAEASEEARLALDFAITALRPLTLEKNDRDATEAGYRLAQALSDRAEVEPEDQPRSALRSEALALLQKPFEAVPGLEGHALRLKAELLLEEGRPAEALTVIEAASKGTEPLAGFVALKGRALAATGRLDEARGLLGKAVAAGADRDEVTRDVLVAGVSGARSEADREAIAREALGFVSRQEGTAARRGRIAAARAIPAQIKGLSAADREVLAEGLELLGRKADAAAELDAASEAAATGEERGRLRYRGALAWREAGELAASRRGLEAIVADAGAASWHARAALALALGSPGKAVELDALRAVIARYRDSEAANEARILLGWELVSRYRDSEALSVWESVSRGSRRAADARIARIELLLEDLEMAHASGAGGIQVIHDRLVSLLDEIAPSGLEQAVQRTVQFARLCLELIDWMNWRERAEQDLAKALRLPLQREERERLEILDVAVRIREGRHAEGERLARERFGTFGVASLVEGGERLERIASASELDVERRRFGTLCGEAAAVVLGREGLGRRDRFRAVLLASRAAELRGDTPGAVEALAVLEIDPAALSARDRLALAETRRRAGQNAAALGDYDALARLGATGSPLWLAARLGAARCHLAAGRPEVARQVVEATAVLVPELGGDAFRGQFETLLRRAGSGRKR